VNAPAIPEVLKQRFPAGALVPLPPFMNVLPHCVATARIPLGVWRLRAIALRFSGKRLRAVDVRRIKVWSFEFGTLWEADVALAHMLDLYREGSRPARRYVFVDFTEPGRIGGLNLPALRHAPCIDLEIGPDAVAPVVHWWGVYA